MFNAIAHAELSVLPYKGIEIYAQAVLDQARVPNEDDSQAAAWGILGGARYTHPLSLGYIEASLETVYTSPMLYRRDGVDFLMYQREFTYYAGNPIKLYYIGFPYGGDVIMLQGKTEWVIPSVSKISLTVSGMLKGEMTMFKSHNVNGDNTEVPNIRDAAPSGDVMQRFLIVTLGGEYSLPELWGFLESSLWSEISFVAADKFTKSTGIASDGRFDIQFVLGMSLKI